MFDNPLPCEQMLDIRLENTTSQINLLPNVIGVNSSIAYQVKIEFSECMKLI